MKNYFKLARKSTHKHQPTHAGHYAVTYEHPEFGRTIFGYSDKPNGGAAMLFARNVRWAKNLKVETI
jgi:hypothetical protein